MLYYTILYYTILYYTILYYTILYYTILYYVRFPVQGAEALEDGNLEEAHDRGAGAKQELRRVVEVLFGDLP